MSSWHVEGMAIRREDGFSSTFPLPRGGSCPETASTGPRERTRDPWETPARRAFHFLTSILLLAVFCVSSPAQINQYHFTRFTPNEGLPDSNVHRIIQDAQGYMWFGTANGLCRYDGYEFTVYKHQFQDPRSLSDNFVSSLFADSQGRLWAGTQNGLNRFDPATESFQTFLVQASEASGQPVFVSAILEDGGGGLWVGTEDGLYQFHPDQGILNQYTHDPANPDSISSSHVTTLLRDSRGVLWIGTSGGGLNQMDESTRRFTHYKHRKDDPSSLSSNFVMYLLADRDGTLWIGTWNGGLNRMNRETGTFTALPEFKDMKITSLLKDHDQHLWVGTWAHGLFYLDSQLGRTVQFMHDPTQSQSLSSNTIDCLWEDRSGMIWAGTIGGGINQCHRQIGRFVNYSHSLDSNSLSADIVYSLWEDREGILWVGTYEGGLNRLDRQSETFTRYDVPGGPVKEKRLNTVLALLEDSRGALWTGTYGHGLMLFDRDTQIFHALPGSGTEAPLDKENIVRAIAEDRDGFIWYGTDETGLHKIDAAGNSLASYTPAGDSTTSLSDHNVTCILPDRHGYLWIGTAQGGLNRFDPATQTFTRYQSDPHNPGALSYNKVSCLHEDRAGFLWIGTANGLNRLNPGAETFRKYLMADGLPDNSIRGIQEDAMGNLWLSTNRGISRFSPAAGIFRNFYQKDGLATNEFGSRSCFQNRKGEMFFGGAAGFTVFRPERVTINTHVPPVVMTGFSIMGKSISTHQLGEDHAPVNLSFQDKFFTFQFAALDFTNPAMNQYAYRLEGFDPDWVYCGSRRYGNYTNLSPGSYTLRVKGANNDGVWNETGLAVPIVVHPPFWRTWWFLLSSLAALGMSVLGAYRRRIARFHREQAQLERLIADRTAELRRKNQELEQSIAQREEALRKVKTLSGLIPICAYCKKVRNDEGYWNQIESYIRDHSDADFSHSICPSCFQKLYPEYDDSVDRSTPEPDSTHSNP